MVKPKGIGLDPLSITISAVTIENDLSYCCENNSCPLYCYGVAFLVEGTNGISSIVTPLHRVVAADIPARLNVTIQ